MSAEFPLPLPADLLAPDRIIVVGASRDPGSVGHSIWQNLLAGERRVELHAINPHPIPAPAAFWHANLADLPYGGGILAVHELVLTSASLAELDPASIERLDAALPAIWSGGNPVDIIGDADAARYRGALDVLLDDSSSDAALVMNCPTGLLEDGEAARTVAQAVKESALAWVTGHRASALSASIRSCAISVT